MKHIGVCPVPLKSAKSSSTKPTVLDYMLMLERFVLLMNFIIINKRALASIKNNQKCLCWLILHTLYVASSKTTCHQGLLKIGAQNT